ncbi:CHAT domain-containing protein [Granulicoccus sp. GXG6511]|uniref:CHAT domain-containing protein n=1 Tax=Granulicoccus sp. GXG6511 TaxID=3381351 RepID=UPI003D7E0E96
MSGQSILQIVGDGIAGNWITWRWADGGLGVAEVRGLESISNRFRDALPTGPQGLSLDGELTNPEREAELMAALADVLLPPRLRAEILAGTESGTPLHIRVAPTPLAAAVPWGLLPLDAERRLLDVADISWIAPVLPRDVVDAAPPAPVDGATSLHVIDPDQRLGRVLTEADRSVLGTRAAGRKIVGESFGAADMSAELRAGASRLLFVGHCVRSGPAATAGLVLSDVDRWTPDPLTAQELIADPDRWPMPPRVAVLACASGADLTDYEPFGLATALLHNGADTVHATLWTLPTDRAFALQGVPGPVLLPMALAFDEAQTAADPVSALCAWQRRQLRRWRDEPSLGTSPLVWGAALTMTAPRERHRKKQSPGPVSDDTDPSM